MMKADFRSRNFIYCCTWQVLSIHLKIRGKTRFRNNTDSKLTNMLLSGTATSAAVKYPVEVDSFSSKIWWEEGERRHLNRSWSNLSKLKCTPPPIQSSRKRNKCWWSSITVLYSATQSAMLAPNGTWGARVATPTAPGLTNSIWAGTFCTKSHMNELKESGELLPEESIWKWSEVNKFCLCCCYFNWSTVISGIQASAFCFIPTCILTSEFWYPNIFIFLSHHYSIYSPFISNQAVFAIPHSDSLPFRPASRFCYSKFLILQRQKGETKGQGKSCLSSYTHIEGKALNMVVV